MFPQHRFQPPIQSIGFPVARAALGSPGNAKNCVNGNKYPTGELGGFPGEQRATMWEKNLGDRLTVLCSIYAAVQ